MANSKCIHATVCEEIYTTSLMCDECECYEPVQRGYWTGIEGDECSVCGRYLSEIMDADSYYAIGFDPNQLVACPFCGAKMDGGKSNV